MDAIIKSLVEEIQALRLDVMRLQREVSEKKISNTLLTMKEACDFLRIGRSTMQRRLSSGEITFAIKKGKSWVFPFEKLKDYASGY